LPKQQQHEGNFIIRFEPKAVLQTQAVIPFEIDVKDDLHNPLVQEKVTLQIETPEHTNNPEGFAIRSDTPVPAINYLENTAHSWYDAGWVDARERSSVAALHSSRRRRNGSIREHSPHPRGTPSAIPAFGPKFVNLDQSVQRRFSVTERYSFTLRVDAFDA
jgi:hypothetical protein